MRNHDTWLVRALTAFVDAMQRAQTVTQARDLAAAEIAVSTRADVVAAMIEANGVAISGPRSNSVAEADLVAASTSGPAAEIAGIGRCDVSVHSGGSDVRLVIVRTQGAISRRERDYLALAAKMLAISVAMLGGAERERDLRMAGLTEIDEHNRLLGTLLKRQQLLDNLGRIERSISQRVPLGQMLATITDAVHQLLGDDLIALRLLDPDDPDYLIVVSDSGVSPDIFNEVRRTPVGAGVGGRAVAEDALVVVDDYPTEAAALEAFVTTGVQAAVAAPVHEQGVVVGSLTVATYDPLRRYGPIEQETVLAFAEHVSLALTDARTVQDMQAAEQVKDNLLAMVSHELKTPLTVMLGVVQTIQRHASRLPDDVRDEMLMSAQERGFELGRLIDRLLEGAQRTASDDLQDASLPAFIAAAVAPYSGSGRHLLIPPVPPQPLRVDVAKVHGALSNILENAITESPEGTPIVIEVDSSGGEVSVTVTAEGRLPHGIDTDALFERAAQPTTSAMGLGLYLASHLAAAAGGSLSAAEADGRMSYTLRFPAGAQAPTAARTRPVVLP
ncbi:MAG: GAF domain-containing protein [Mycobacteriales bacterium]